MSGRADDTVRGKLRVELANRRAAGPETWQHCTLLYPPTSGSPPTTPPRSLPPDTWLT